MIPNLPYIVRVTHKVTDNRVAQRNYNCHTLSEAFVRKANALGSPLTTRVEVLLIIDDVRPGDTTIPA